MEIIRKDAQMKKSSIQSVINRLIQKGIDSEMYNKSTFDKINEIRKKSKKGNNMDLVRESRESMK